MKSGCFGYLLVGQRQWIWPIWGNSINTNLWWFWGEFAFNSLVFGLVIQWAVQVATWETSPLPVPFFQGRGKLRFAGVVGTGLVRMVAVRTLRYFKIETKWHNCWRSCLFPKYQGFGICGWFVSCLQCWICVCVLCNVCVCEYLYFYMCYISSGWMLPITMPVVMDFEALRFVEILIPTGFSAMDDDRDRSKTICLVTTLYEHMKTEYCLCWSGQNIVIGLFFSTEMIGVQESSRPWINHQVHPKS